MISLFCILHIFKILDTRLSYCPSPFNKTILAAHADKNCSDSWPETFPKGSETKNSVSQTVTLIHGVQRALSTVRYRERGNDTHRGHPSMPLQEMGSFLLGLDW